MGERKKAATAGHLTAGALLLQGSRRPTSQLTALHGGGKEVADNNATSRFLQQTYGFPLTTVWRD